MNAISSAKDAAEAASNDIYIARLELMISSGTLDLMPINDPTSAYADTQIPSAKAIEPTSDTMLNPLIGHGLI